MQDVLETLKKENQVLKMHIQVLKDLYLEGFKYSTEDVENVDTARIIGTLEGFFECIESDLAEVNSKGNYDE